MFVCLLVDRLKFYLQNLQNASPFMEISNDTASETLCSTIPQVSSSSYLKISQESRCAIFRHDTMLISIIVIILKFGNPDKMFLCWKCETLCNKKILLHERKRPTARILLLLSCTGRRVPHPSRGFPIEVPPAGVPTPAPSRGTPPPPRCELTK